MAIVQFGDHYRGKKVFVTGNTGFKGSWLSLWLHQLGAIVHGYSDEVPTQPSHHELLALPFETTFGDVRDLEGLGKAVERFSPDLIFHLAAQPLVLDSFVSPLETFQTNLMGSLNLLEVVRRQEMSCPVIVATTDKVYENKEWVWSYREVDRLGGKDPYSASKAALEIAAFSYHQSFFAEKSPQQIRTVRAGNVIGGGDWAKDRLIPDLVRAASISEATPIRSRKAVRPWQHVLEPLSAYLLLGEKMMTRQAPENFSFNFGPREGQSATVEQLIHVANKSWEQISARFEGESSSRETRLLALDSTLADVELSWRPVWGFSEAIEETIGWYRSFYQDQKVRSEDCLQRYFAAAKESGAVWT